jgi:ATP-dependent Clp protease ATP-binding subunit ClpA
MDENGIVGLAHRAERSLDPDEGLAAIPMMRQRLAELEEEHVERALEAGWSWARIGARLRISRQAAHRRHRELRQRSRRRYQRLQLTDPLREALVRAAAEAEAMQQCSVEAGHLLLGIACADRGAARKLLHESGITDAHLRERVHRHYSRTVGEEGSPSKMSQKRERPVTEWASQLRLGRSTAQALRDGLREAGTLGAATVAPEHVLLALLRQEGARWMLTGEARVTPEQLRARLRDELETGTRGEAHV